VLVDVRQDQTWNKLFVEGAKQVSVAIKNITVADASVSSIGVIVSGLRRYMVLKNEDLQLHGTAVLYAMSLDLARMTAAKISKAGGVEVAIAAMVMHPSCLPLNQQCCNLLHHMLCYRKYGWGRLSERQSNTAVRVVLDAITRFSQDFGMQKDGITCLTALSSFPVSGQQYNFMDYEQQIAICRQQTIRMRCLEVAMAAMQTPNHTNNNDNEVLDSCVCKLLLRFVKGERAHWQQSAGQDCIKHVVTAIVRSLNLKNESALLSCVELIDAISECPECVQTIVLVDGIQVLLRVLSSLEPEDANDLENTMALPAFQTKTHMQISVCGALSRIASAEGCVDAVVQAGGVVALFNTVRHTQHHTVRMTACEALCNVAGVDGEQRMFMCTPEGLQLLTELF